MKKYGLIVGLVFAVVILVLGVMLLDKIPSLNERTINGQGSATLTGEADEVAVYVNIETLRKSAEEARDENSRISDNVLMGIYELGISKDDVETAQYNIYEEFDYSNGRKSLGFKAVNVLKIKLRDFTKVGRVVDKAVGNGATGIQMINFELSEERQGELKKEALKKASEDARVKAEAVAEGLGVKLGKIVAVSTDSYDYRPYPLFETAMEAQVAKERVAETVILPSDLEVNAMVTVSFEVKE